MDQLKFEGDTLGQRHRNYNNFVTNAKCTKEDITEIDVNAEDVNNLFKVDLAGRNRDVEYIIEVLKGNDLLYVSRAIKQCDWLITDNQYAHIINPDYLFSQLFPLMMSKATNKLMLSIRLKLRDETRVESFFNHYENLDLNTALKWLPYCSTAFIDAKVEKHCSSISTPLLSRLCEKSHNALKIVINQRKKFYDYRYSIAKTFQTTMFLLNTHTDFYLDLIESCNDHDFPKFNLKGTKFIMKVCPERIHKHFLRYANSIHLPTFVKFLNPNDIKNFLLKQMKNDKVGYMQWLHLDNLQHFIKRMPQEEGVRLIKEAISVDTETEGSKTIEIVKLYRSIASCFTCNPLLWYRFAPFDTALAEIKEKIKLITDTREKGMMLNCLTQIVGNSPQHIEELLQYYNENHLNDSRQNKSNFTSNLCQYTDFFKYNSKCWNLLNDIFISMSIYDDNRSNFNHEELVSMQAIIMYKVINKEEIPDTIMKQCNYQLLIQYRKRLNSEEKSQLFKFLYDRMSKKIENEDFKTQTLFDDNVNSLRLMLTLLSEWQKNLADYPKILSKIKDLVQIKQDSKQNLSWIYDLNKTWRRSLFEDSIKMCPCEKICLNSLKHDPSLLTRNEKVVSQLRSNDTISLKQLLRKLKIYWPRSIASEWAEAYRRKLEEPVGHKALMRGLNFLLPQRDILKIIDHYKPEKARIDWVKDDEIILSLRKHLAKNMHYARPQPDPNVILQYAKGDYLQFALPSLSAVLHNLPADRCRALVPRLLDSPVSLQKHGIRLAFSKMRSEDLHRTFCNYWKTIKNASIRAVMFKLAHKLLCKEKNSEKVNNIWELLNIFMDGLTFEEDKAIYKLLSEVEKIPLKVKPLYLMKSYNFLKSLLPESGLERNKYEESLNSLIYFITDLIESMDSNFVANILHDYISAVYTTEKKEVFITSDIVPLMVSYILYTKSSDEQRRRYESVLIPILKHTFSVWEDNDSKNEIIKVNFNEILNQLCNFLSNVVIKNMAIPVHIFEDIQNKLDVSIPQTKNYILLREWKMAAAFVSILNNKKTAVRCQQESESQPTWDNLCEQCVPEFSKVCVKLLKEDIKLFFPCIYEYFSKSLRTVLDRIFNKKFQIEVLKCILTEDLIESYLLTIMTLNNYYDNESQQNLEQLHQEILSHPSLEVKMHFYHKKKAYRI